MRLLLCLALLACTNNSTNTGDDAACSDLAGRWVTSGTCGDDVCQISQNACSLTAVTCSSGAHSTSGTVDGDAFSYTGVSGAGAAATCSGTLTGGNISGTCTVNGAGTCSFSGHP
jgi:hypothetical protein